MREILNRPPWTEKATPMDAVFMLTVVVFAFGGIAAALAWAEAQNRGPGESGPKNCCCPH
jgi:tryptophan-rich sensory protein